MKVVLQNPAGLTKQCKIGFSWTTFFFGFLPALFRGDLKWAAIMCITAVVVGSFTLGFGAWIPGIIFSFIYNKLYIKELIEKGYQPATTEDRELLEQKQIISKVA
ncbi:DUF2628 domain-containing protein [Neobacillus sedimentimangrovi]|jgi:hypothetical protein|uniref:DUF2628 domain-containing protein n=2 Tax=Neobacillus TaxID=2675232 RepID=A0A6B3TV64_9BACI|nr:MULTISPECIES: DUF2628 domain-containing protein [Neobacillus]MCD4838329.1 DUF2628 domain-containing protein [Neobacillus sedimentimangrovi]NEX80239.1 DUF2628 domain-containing protein [Neobacillus thermocopriae]